MCLVVLSRKVLHLRTTPRLLSSKLITREPDYPATTKKHSTKLATTLPRVSLRLSHRRATLRLRMTGHVRLCVCGRSHLMCLRSGVGVPCTDGGHVGYCCA